MAASGRTIPSILGGGLERGTRAILEATLEREEREQRRDLAERQLGIAERTQAINQITTLVDFMEPGTTLGEAGPAVQTVFGRAFDIDTEGLEDLELNRETVATALNARGVEVLDTPEGETLALQGVRAMIGLEPSEDVAQARDTEAQMRFNALTSIQQDPELMAEHVERVLGRDPINLRIPGVEGEPDRIIPFETSTAARLHAQFLLQRENFSMRLRLQEMEEGNPLVEEVQNAVSEAGSSVSSTALQRVFQVYNEAVQAGDAEVINSFLQGPASQGEKLALRFLTGSILTGEAAFLNSIDPRLANFYRILTAVGSETDPEQTIAIMQSITQAIDPTLAGVLEDPFVGGLQLDLSTDVPEGGPARDPGAGSEEGGLDPDAMVTDAMIRQAFDAGDPPMALADRFGEERVQRVLGEEAMIGELEPEVREGVQIPEGGMNPDAVPIPLRRDVQQLNRLIRTLERTRGELARGNLERAIERIKERIRVGVSSGG